MRFLTLLAVSAFLMFALARAVNYEGAQAAQAHPVPVERDE